jgi:3-isopropylmalate/(R)-2-methylmalate dehydratase small subunit
MSMQPFTTHTGVALPLDEANVDTNQLCPTRFNKVPRGPKYREILFHDQRFDGEGRQKGFVLDRPPYDRTSVIVGDANFGCGSSRETAVYALYEFGVRCVIAPSFGDIFAANCAKNGLLALTLPEAECAAIRRQLAARPGASVTVDLAAQTVTDPESGVHRFEIHPVRKNSLLKGLDDIARTEEYRGRIEAFEARHRAAHPWFFASPPERKPGT